MFLGQPDFNNAPTANGNLRLQPNSPAVNKGSTAANSTLFDLDGKQRKIGTIDLGAYEVQSSASALGYFFRSTANGNWNDMTTWEMSDDEVNWQAANIIPDDNAISVTIQDTHIVTVTADVTTNKVTVNTGGQLIVKTGVTLTTK